MARICTKTSTNQKETNDVRFSVEVDSTETAWEQKYNDLKSTFDRMLKVSQMCEGNGASVVVENEIEVERSNVSNVVSEEQKNEERNIKKKASALRKKRIAEKRMARRRACIKTHLGSLDILQFRTYGYRKMKKRVYTFKCPECSEKIEINLERHLVLKHKYKLKYAKMKQSEIRVMYLWASDDKNGKHLPLHVKNAICGLPG